jgi:hypothetical protein
LKPEILVFPRKYGRFFVRINVLTNKYGIGYGIDMVRTGTTKGTTMNISKIYEQAEKIAKMPRKARRLHISRVCRANPGLNVYDLQDIINLYATASK